jgi:hypothetical protein
MRIKGSPESPYILADFSIDGISRSVIDAIGAATRFRIGLIDRWVTATQSYLGSFFAIPVRVVRRSWWFHYWGRYPTY